MGPTLTLVQPTAHEFHISSEEVFWLCFLWAGALLLLRLGRYHYYYNTVSSAWYTTESIQGLLQKCYI